MTIKTHRLLITELDPSMAESLHMLSLDEDTRRYLPDEVFETAGEALETIGYLLACRESGLGPQVLAVTLGSELVGYVQASPIPEGWEIGYHIGGAFTGRGYATEAVRAFLPVIQRRSGSTGSTASVLQRTEPRSGCSRNAALRRYPRGSASIRVRSGR